MSDKPTYEQLEKRILVLEETLRRCRLDEDELQEAQDFTAAVMKTAGALVVVLDKEGRFVRFNRTCERLTGYTFEEVEGRFLWDIFLTPEETTPVQEVFKALCAGQFPSKHENDWVTKDGRRLRVMWANTALTDRDGNVIYVVGTGIDITERKIAERALKESEERYRRITEAVSDYNYTVIVEDGFPVDTVHGAACEAVTGYTQRDFDANPYLWIQMVPEEDQQVVEEQAQLLLDKVRAEPIEHRIIRKDGAVRWVRNTAVPYFDGKGKLISYEGILKDITDEKNAEQALRISEANYRLLFSSGSDAIVIVDGESKKIVDANPAALALYGYEEDAFIGLDAAALSSEPEQSTARIETVTTEGPAEGSRNAALRLHKKKDGTTFPVEISLGVYALKNNTFVCAIIRDITERMDVEEALRRSLEEMESQVNEQTARLVVANEDLKREIAERKQIEMGLLESEERLYDEEKRMEMLQFANDIALNLMHELRNPLVSIGGFSRRLHSGNYSREKQKEYVRVIFEESVKLEQVLDKVLAHLKETASHSETRGKG